MMKQLIKQSLYAVNPVIKSSPDFLIIGVQRAGTTSLYHYLCQHPQIVVTHRHRETYYFDHCENYRQGLGWYLKHFPSKFHKGNNLTFEASPSYLFYSQVPELIYKDLGNQIKMIVSLRNPVTRAYSAWQMYHSYANLPLKHLKERADTRTFVEAMTQELNPETNTASYPYNYLERGKYVNQLENYFRYFSRESFLILNFEQSFTNLEATLKQVCEFLNIPSFSPLDLEKFKQEKQGSANYIKSPEDEPILNQLQEYFAPYNEKLYQLLGRQFNWY